MSKKVKIFFLVFTSVFVAGVAANVVCEVFRTKFKKYYSVD